MDSLSVERIPNQQSVNVTWKYNDPCIPDQFIVGLYSERDDKLLQTRETTTKSAVLDGLVACVSLYACVTAQNANGMSRAQRSQTFTIFEGDLTIFILRFTVEPCCHHSRRMCALIVCCFV